MGLTIPRIFLQPSEFDPSKNVFVSGGNQSYCTTLTYKPPGRSTLNKRQTSETHKTRTSCQTNISINGRVMLLLLVVRLLLVP